MLAEIASLQHDKETLIDDNTETLDDIMIKKYLMEVLVKKPLKGIATVINESFAR